MNVQKAIERVRQNRVKLMQHRFPQLDGDAHAKALLRAGKLTALNQYLNDTYAMAAKDQSRHRDSLHPGLASMGLDVPQTAYEELQERTRERYGLTSTQQRQRGRSRPGAGLLRALGVDPDVYEELQRRTRERYERG